MYSTVCVVNLSRCDGVYVGSRLTDNKSGIVPQFGIPSHVVELHFTVQDFHFKPQLQTATMELRRTVERGATNFTIRLFVAVP